MASPFQVQSWSKRGRSAKKSSDVGAEEEGGSRILAREQEGYQVPQVLLYWGVRQRVYCDMCSMQMPQSIELAAGDIDFEDEGVSAPSAKTTLQEKTGKGKGKSRTPSSSQQLPVGRGM